LAYRFAKGGHTDARTVKARAEAFLQEEVFKACQLFADNRVDTALAGIAGVAVEIDPEFAGEVANRLFRDSPRPAVLFVGDARLGEFYAQVMPEVDWCMAANADQTLTSWPSATSTSCYWIWRCKNTSRRKRPSWLWQMAVS
jgi:hypothetical protein